MLTGTGRGESPGLSSSADPTTPRRRRTAAPVAPAAAIGDVSLPAGRDYSSAEEVTRAADDLDAAAGMLRRRAENICAGVPVTPLGPPPPPRQSWSRSLSRRRGSRH